MNEYIHFKVILAESQEEATKKLRYEKFDDLHDLSERVMDIDAAINALAAYANSTPDEGQSTLTLHYRDGANYKYSQEFTVPTALLKRAMRVHGFYDQEEPQIRYDNDLGIEVDSFHDTIGTAYDEGIDHSYVIVTHINGKPNVKDGE